MWAASARRAVASRFNSSRLVVSGVVVMVVLGTAGFVVGHGMTGLHLRIQPGEAWLPTTTRGSVSLVNGQSGRSSAELLLNGARGHYLVVSQVGDEVLVRDTRTGMLIRINTMQLALGAAVRTQSRSVVVAGLAATYVVNYSAGTVQRIDPVTLTPLGALMHVAGVLGTTAVVDRNGTLWVPVISNGTVIPVTSNGTGNAIHVGSGAADLVMTTAGGVPIVVNRSSHRLITVGLSGEQGVVTLPASAVAGGSQALLVPASGGAGTLPVVNPNGSPTLLIIDLHSGSDHSVPLGAEVTGHDLGAPVQGGRRIFIPDYTSGSVLVYDTAGAGLAATIPVTGHRGTFGAQVIDGIAYFNDPNGDDAVVVTPDGQVHQVRKTGPGVPTARRRPSQAPAPASTPSSGPPGPGHGHRSPGPVPTATASPQHTPKPKPSPSPTPASPTPTPTPPPLAPQNPQAVSGPGNVAVSWQPPASGGPVSSYTVGISPPDAGAVQSKTGPTSVQVTGLSCATVYTFTVYSVGSGGQQVPAPPVTARRR
jgi:Fibronectin type III domain